MSNKPIDIFLKGFVNSDWTTLIGSDYQDSTPSGEISYVLTQSLDSSLYIAGKVNSTNSYGQDLFVSKFDSDGNRKWSTEFGTEMQLNMLGGREEISEIITDKDGSIYVIGNTQGPLNGQSNPSGPNSLYGDYYASAFITKLGVDGEQEWTKILGSQYYDYANHIQISSDGYVYVAGTTTPSSPFDGNQDPGPIFLVKFDSAGIQQWINFFGEDNGSSINDLTLDASGDIYITGQTFTDFEDQINEGDRSSDAYISKVDSDGTKEWTILLGPDNDIDGRYSGPHVIGSSLTISGDGSLYVVGYTEDDLNGEEHSTGFDGDKYHHVQDLFLSKFNSNGTREWTKLFVDSVSDGSSLRKAVSSTKLSTDENGSVYLFKEGFSITKIKSNGEFDLTHSFGRYPSGFSYTNDILYDFNGSIFITGYTSEDLDGLHNTGNDSFLIKLSEVEIDSINEGSHSGYVIGQLSTLDDDNEDSHTYKLIEGEGSSDNSKFSIDRNLLKINSTLDYETNSSFSIRIQTLDNAGNSLEKKFVLQVKEENQAPTDMTLSNESFDEDAKENFLVANISSTDEDSNQHNYYLDHFSWGESTYNNSYFKIDGDKLLLKNSLDYETQNSYEVSIKSIDKDGNSLIKNFVLQLNDVDEAPEKISFDVTSKLEDKWTKLVGSSETDYSFALNIAEDGSMYVGGDTFGNIDDVNNSQYYDGFFTKFNQDGLKEWTKLIYPTLDQNISGDINSLESDSSGNIYIGGRTVGIGSTDGYIAKLKNDGTKIWSNIISSEIPVNWNESYDPWDEVKDIAITTEDEIYVAGTTRGDLDGNVNPSYYSGFLKKYKSDGTKEWTTIFDSSANVILPDNKFTTAEKLAVGLDNSIYVAGRTSGDLYEQEYSGGSGDDVFLSKYKSDGTELWTRVLGAYHSETIGSLEVGKYGSVYITGSVQGDLDGQTNSSSAGAFLVKYNPDGDKEWTRISNLDSLDLGYYHNIPHSMTFGDDGSIYIASEVKKPSSYTTSGETEIYITKFLTDGTKKWEKSISDESDTFDISYAIETGLDGSLYLSGHSTDNFKGEINNGSTDVFLTKFQDEIGKNNDGTISSGFIFAHLSTTDQDANDNHTYELVSGSGSTHNELFIIDQDRLKANHDFEYPTQTSYEFRLRTTDNKGLYFENAYILNGSEISVNNNIIVDNSNESSSSTTDTNKIVVATVNNDYSEDPKGFASISASSPVTVSAYELGKETTLDSIKDYDGNLHAGDNLEETASSYKYQGMLDVNGDGVFEAIFTNQVSKRWVTAKVDSTTGQIDFNDNGAGGGTRVVGIYEDPLIAEGASNGGFLADGVTPAPANFGVSDEERYVEVNGEKIDRLALNSQVRFQNDLDIDNLSAKHSGDYDGDGIHEVYWKTNDGTAYLRALMHDDGNIRYANYQNQVQMSNYLTGEGHSEIISDII